MANDQGDETEIQPNGGGVPRIIDLLEARKRDLEVDDQRRIAEGETLPWLGKRESWLDPK